MIWETFEGRLVSDTTIDHQHLSNCIWYLRIFFSATDHQLLGLLNQIDQRFNGQLLEYRPLKRFKEEIIGLANKGMIKYGPNETVAEVHFNGKKIGEIV